jgi:hypothetical protein
VHPLEQLRYVARGWESTDDLPMAEVAQVLAELAEESPATLLHACRRLIEYFPASGRLWWLSARALSAPEPVSGIWEAADELLEDPTGKRLAEALPAGAGVSLLGPASEAAMSVLRRRRAREGGVPKKTANKNRGHDRSPRGPDQSPRGPDRSPRGQERERGGPERENRGPDVLVVSALAAGPGALLLDAAVARQVPGLVGRERTVWAVVPRGTVLPEALWHQLLTRARGAAGVETLSPECFSALAGPNGLEDAADILSSPTCPPVAELLGWRS